MLEPAREIFGYIAELDERQRLILAVFVLLLFLAQLLAPLAYLSNSWSEKAKRMEEKVRMSAPKLQSVAQLKGSVSALLEKAQAGASLDPTTYLRSIATDTGVKVKTVKASKGKREMEVEVKTLTVEFTETSLSAVSRLVERLESSPYMFRVHGISLSDTDGNGLVSGKLHIDFARKASRRHRR